MSREKKIVFYVSNLKPFFCGLGLISLNSDPNPYIKDKLINILTKVHGIKFCSLEEKKICILYPYKDHQLIIQNHIQ